MNRKQKYLAVSIIVLGLVLCALLLWKSPAPAGNPSPEVLTVKNLAVGSADCAVLYCGGGCAVIDTGEEDDYPALAAELAGSGVESVDLLVLTHFDKDHIGSAVQLLRNYEVETVFLPDYAGAGRRWEALCRELESHGDVRFLSGETEIEWRGASVTISPAEDPEAILASLDPGEEIDNDLSLLCMVRHGDNRLLFAGDIEKARIRQLLSGNTELACDWLKYPHHGRYKKLHRDMLEAMAPTWAVVSCSAAEPAEKKTGALLEERGIRWFSTENGSVITVSDGKSLTVRQR